MRGDGGKVLANGMMLFVIPGSIRSPDQAMLTRVGITGMVERTSEAVNPSGEGNGRTSTTCTNKSGGTPF